MDLQITVRRHSDLTTAETSAIIDLCTLAFAGPMDAYVTQHSGGAHLLAMLNQTLVGHACWVPRRLQPQGLPLLETAYVEEMGVHPDHQRSGIGTAVMRRMAEVIKDFELAALATGSVGFYSRLGWELWRGKNAIRTEQGLQITPEEGLMILRLARTPPVDLDTVISAEWRPGDWW